MKEIAVVECVFLLEDIPRRVNARHHLRAPLLVDEGEVIAVDGHCERVRVAEVQRGYAVLRFLLTDGGLLAHGGIIALFWRVEAVAVVVKAGFRIEILC